MKLNKYIIIFISIFLGINTILFTALNKYFFILLHQTITFCKEVSNFISPNLFKNTGLVIFLILSAILLMAIIRLLITLVKMFFLKVYLNENTVKTSKDFSVVNSSKPYAFCFGIVSPKIYISTKLISLLTKNELKVVIAHENYHLKNYDTITLMLANIFESLFPYFPLITNIIKHYKIERELKADESAIAGSGRKNLIYVLKKLLKYEPKFAYSEVPAIADFETLEVRISKLTTNKNYNKKFEWKSIVISFISLTFLFVLILIPLSLTESHATGNDTVILCVDKKMSSYYTL